MSFHPYRAIDLYPSKRGVDAIIDGYLFKFEPWYFDGKTVWHGKKYSLRSEAEAAADQLVEEVANVTRDNMRLAVEEQCQAQRKA